MAAYYSLSSFERVALENTISKAIQVCSATIFFYYCALHLREEVAYIWTKKWSAGKAMYLIVRYSGAGFLILMVASIINVTWNDGSVDSKDYSYPTVTYLKLCLWGYLYIGPGSIIILLAEVILQMRVYALYGKKKKVLALLVILTVVSLGVDILQPFGFPYEAANLICLGGPCKKKKGYRKRYQEQAFSCSTASIPMSSIGWLTASLVELILFVLVFRKSRQVKKDRVVSSSLILGDRLRPQTRDIFATMAKDSTMYFAVIFTVCLIGTCLSFITEIQTDDKFFVTFIRSQLNTFQTVVLTIMTLLAPKLLINLRMEYYGPTGLLTENTQMTWDVAGHGPADEHEDTESEDQDVQDRLLGSHSRAPSGSI